MFEFLENFLYPRKQKINGEDYVVFTGFRLDGATALLCVKDGDMPYQLPFGGSSGAIDCKIIIMADKLKTTKQE